MKHRQIVAILSALFIVLTVFCSCKKEELEFIPNTTEITFDTGEESSAEIFTQSKAENENTATVLVQGTTATTKENQTSSTTKKTSETTSYSTTTAKTTTKRPDNSVVTQPKTTTTTTKKDTSTTTKKPTTSGTTSTVATTKIPTTSTTVSTSTITPLTARLKYLNEPTNSFISKLTEKDLSSYNMSEADKASFLSDRSGWAEYTLRIYFKNNDTAKRATVYMLQVKDNGKNGVYIDCDPKGDLSIAPGNEPYVLFNVLVKDGSMLDTLVLKTASEMQISVKYAETPENDSDIPNYKYAIVE